MLAEPGGGGRPRQGRGRSWAGPRGARPCSTASQTQPEGAGLSVAPPTSPASRGRPGPRVPNASRTRGGALLSHAPLSPTRVRLAQPKEGNERPEGLENSGPAHVAPAYHRAPQPAGAWPRRGEAGPEAGRGRAAQPEGGAALPTPPPNRALSARAGPAGAIATAAFIIAWGRSPTPPGPRTPSSALASARASIRPPVTPLQECIFFQEALPGRWLPGPLGLPLCSPPDYFHFLYGP